MTNDNISDMLTRIRNASMAKHRFTTVIYSKVNLAILKVLLAEGYITNYEVENISNKNDELKNNKNLSETPNQKVIKIILLDIMQNIG